MSTAMLDHRGVPPLEVRVYDHGRLLGREPCESEQAAAGVVARWSDLATLVVVADSQPSEGPADHTGSEDAAQVGNDGGCPLADLPLPGYGTE